MATYTISPSGDILLALTQAEAKHLFNVAYGGLIAFLSDDSSRRGYIGGPSAVAATERGVHALRDAIQASQNSGRGGT
ncbi:MAG TPA: hypothetical protein VKA48_02675 [Gammaproteobacteria bacterium]|nr:hypothetical protein [Gammaproteobacteria bacterium]